MLHRRNHGGSAGWGRLSLLAAAAAWTLWCGCLTPPPIEEEPRSESAPVVDPTLISPTTNLVEFDLPTDPDQEFSVAGAVTDPDGDALSYYWFLLEEEEQEGEVPRGSGRSTHYVRPCREALTPSDEDIRFLFLQLDVSDRPRLQGPDGSELDEPRSYPEDAHVVTLEWVLVLQGSCPL